MDQLMMFQVVSSEPVSAYRGCIWPGPPLSFLCLSVPRASQFAGIPLVYLLRMPLKEDPV